MVYVGMGQQNGGTSKRDFPNGVKDGFGIGAGINDIEKIFFRKPGQITIGTQHPDGNRPDLQHEKTSCGLILPDKVLPSAAK